MRFFFAIMVFWSHIQFFDQAMYPGYNKLYNNVLSEGYIGVGFFFILSGFILSYNYDDKIINRKISFKKFWVARIARIYPLHIAGSIMAILIIVNSVKSSADFFATPALSVSIFLSNITLLHSFIPDVKYFFSYNWVSWSISDELFFYIVFPFIIYFFVKNKLLIKFGWVLYLLIPVLIYYSGHSSYDNHKFFYINPFFRIVDFILGINLNQLFKLEIFSRLYKKKISATVLEIMSIGMFAGFMYIHEDVPQVYRYSCFYWLPMSLIIFSFAYQNGYLSSLISGYFFVLLGEMSFSFYIFHQLLVRYFVFENNLMVITENPYLLVFAILMTSLFVSYLAHKYIELPCNAYIKNRYKRSSFALPAKG
ncbi:acyltransferase [Hymenobacter aerilatus]|uniref:Acyltransferase n=1 Tax=Hymenobacter aerilatus TaxID=2932251 RepID=A0A8T9SY18_9BACT|nr:acyltransferase [Hymenobacter aerilatus]UOR06755.1 acyltransferase [Hymenobacter aerilatus]